MFRRRFGPGLCSILLALLCLAGCGFNSPADQNASEAPERSTATSETEVAEVKQRPLNIAPPEPLEAAKPDHDDNSVDGAQAKTQDDSVAQELPPLGKVYDLTFNADGSKIACISSDRHVRIYGTESLKLQSAFSTQAKEEYAIAWNSKRDLIAVACDDAIRVWDVGGKLANTFKGFHLSVAWSPDGQLLAAGEDTDYVNFLNMDESGVRAVVRRFSSNGVTFSHLSWHPDGELLACSSAQSPTKYVVSAKTGKFVRIESEQRLEKAHAWKPSGELLAVSGVDAILLFHPDGTLADTWRNDGIKNILALAWSPDGKYLAAAGVRSAESPAGVIFLWNNDGTKHALLPVNLTGNIMKLCWHPDSQRIAFPGDVSRHSSRAFSILNVQTKDQQSLR